MVACVTRRGALDEVPNVREARQRGLARVGSRHDSTGNCPAWELPANPHVSPLPTVPMPNMPGWSC